MIGRRVALPDSAKMGNGRSVLSTSREGLPDQWCAATRLPTGDTDQVSSQTAVTVSAIAASASAVLTLIAVVIAALTLRGARSDAKEAAARTERDRRERIRPMLVPELQRELLSRGAINLVIKNWGLTPAHNVKVTFDPTAPADLGTLPQDDMMTWLYQTYAGPIPLWPPKWTMSNVYRAGQEDVTPLRVDISYSGPDGYHYDGSFTLDPTPILKTTTSGPSDPKTGSPDERRDAWAKRTAHALEALVRALR